MLEKTDEVFVRVVPHLLIVLWIFCLL